MKIIAPSILACDFLNLKQEIEKINTSKAQWVHFDVMDGNFVPNLSFGPDIFKYFKNNSPLFMDVHLMVINPRFIAQLFIDAGADSITFHYEACQNEQEIFEIIQMIKDQGVKVGLTIKPDTKVEVLDPFLDLLDLVLIMSVEPGFGGQKFIPGALDKLKYLRKVKPNLLLQIDGGIDNTNKDLCYQAGANSLVAGSYLFKQADFSKAVDSLL